MFQFECFLFFFKKMIKLNLANAILLEVWAQQITGKAEGDSSRSMYIF